MWPRLRALFRPATLPADAPQQLAVSARVDDAPGWSAADARPHDYDPALIQEHYQDALAAWRKNPIAWRIIGITTDYLIGDTINISSPNRSLQRFISRFWNHPQNRMDLRLETMADELSRSGDLFVLLFRNEQDGMSYLRFVAKDAIRRIAVAANDWETELSYEEAPCGALPGEPRLWLSPAHPQSADAPAVMLHYAVNRPLGALFGESDLQPVIPWLQRYSRMLEDRVRLHWATRAFLWFVTVPGHKVREKQEQYRTPPESGSIVVKDESERWETANPTLHGVDASHDLKAVRGMIDAGSGHPPHWRGDATTTNLATAKAMQAPTERHLRRRQQYFTFVLQDILFQAYQRAAQCGKARPLPHGDYARLFNVNLPDVSREDNETLARAAGQAAAALNTLSGALPGPSETFNRLFLRTVFKFAGEPQPDDVIAEILAQSSRPAAE